MTEIEREEMALAAKAAGYASIDFLCGFGWANVYTSDGRHSEWNPRDDDGDAFRLMVKLSVATYPPEEMGKSATANPPGHNAPWITVPAGDAPAAATRLAIFRAAVAVGRAMP